ncbi:MAG: DUF2586 family protein [Flavobacteriales bacterium]|jgi:hypothetical protein|nr:DUF2586 family protein [Flavobacteriales bacterium]
MSAFQGPKNKKKNGGLSRRNASTDGVMGILFGGIATSKIALGQVKKLIQPSDAEDLDLNAAYDANNGVLVYHHIKEFFRLSPNGTLYIMLVTQGTSLTNMCDVNNDNLKKLILDPLVNREAKSFGVVLNPDTTTYTPTITNGIDADATAAVVKAQELVDALKEDAIYVDSVLIEGRDAGGTISTMEDMRTKSSENISVIIASDPSIRALDNAYAKYAAVGAGLGMLSVRKVHENLGSVNIIEKPDTKKGDESYPLTDTTAGVWLTASLSNGTLISAINRTEQKVLEDKGYIFAGFYEAYAGIYFNDSPTAVELADDYAYIEMNRVWNKAARYVRRALTPKMKSTINVDSTTGFIAPSTIADWENAALKHTGQMLKDDEISGLSISIDPKQNVLSGNPIIIKISITPKGIAREIVNELGITNPFNA